MYIDDIKMPQTKIVGNLNTDSENIQSIYRNGILDRKMCHARNEKQ